MLADAKSRAKKCGISFKISKAWRARALKQDACAVTGIMFDLADARSNVNPLAPSLDRIDASKGYTDSNTRLVIYFVNVAKSDWSDDQFRTLILASASNMRH